MKILLYALIISIKDKNIKKRKIVEPNPCGYLPKYFMNQWPTQFKCPSFIFGINGARGSNILALPLGLIVQSVPCFFSLTKQDS